MEPSVAGAVNVGDSELSGWERFFMELSSFLFERFTNTHLLDPKNSKSTSISSSGSAIAHSRHTC